MRFALAVTLAALLAPLLLPPGAADAPLGFTAQGPCHPAGGAPLFGCGVVLTGTAVKADLWWCASCLDVTFTAHATLDAAGPAAHLAVHAWWGYDRPNGLRIENNVCDADAAPGAATLDCAGVDFLDVTTQIAGRCEPAIVSALLVEGTGPAPIAESAAQAVMLVCPEPDGTYTVHAPPAEPPTQTQGYVAGAGGFPLATDLCAGDPPPVVTQKTGNLGAACFVASGPAMSFDAFDDASGRMVTWVQFRGAAGAPLGQAFPVCAGAVAVPAGAKTAHVAVGNPEEELRCGYLAVGLHEAAPTGVATHGVVIARWWT